MSAYRVMRAFERIPEITGLELTRHGGKWQGPYYLNGDRHPFRRDKLKFVLWKNDIFAFEEGGKGMSLVNWLIQYGGCPSFKEALRLIDGESTGIKWSQEYRQRVNRSVQYVDPNVLEGARRYDPSKCELFRWMAGMFGEKRVREVWDEYNVTTDGNGNAVFWYVDQDGRILYDKRIAYGEDGHRRKDFFPARKFRVADGYSGRCYFGACVPDDGKKVYICESEKTALLGRLYYGRKFLAVGGKNNLREVDGNMLLLPDMDAREEWEEKGEVWPWWEKWGIPVSEIPSHADIGDMIVWKSASGK